MRRHRRCVLWVQLPSSRFLSAHAIANAKQHILLAQCGQRSRACPQFPQKIFDRVRDMHFAIWSLRWEFAVGVLCRSSRCFHFLFYALGFFILALLQTPFSYFLPLHASSVTHFHDRTPNPQVPARLFQCLPQPSPTWHLSFFNPTPNLFFVIFLIFVASLY